MKQIKISAAFSFALFSIFNAAYAKNVPIRVRNDSNETIHLQHTWLKPIHEAFDKCYSLKIEPGQLKVFNDARAFSPNEIMPQLRGYSKENNDCASALMTAFDFDSLDAARDQAKDKYGDQGLGGGFNCTISNQEKKGNGKEPLSGDEYTYHAKSITCEAIPEARVCARTGSIKWHAGESGTIFIGGGAAGTIVTLESLDDSAVLVSSDHHHQRATPQSVGFSDKCDTNFKFIAHKKSGLEKIYGQFNTEGMKDVFLHEGLSISYTGDHPFVSKLQPHCKVYWWLATPDVFGISGYRPKWEFVENPSHKGQCIEYDANLYKNISWTNSWY